MALSTTRPIVYDLLKSTRIAPTSAKLDELLLIEFKTSQTDFDSSPTWLQASIGRSLIQIVTF